MITESMTMKGLHVNCLALTTIERWEVAGRPFNNSSAAEAWLTVFVLVILTILVILLFRVSASFRHIAKLTVTNEKLWQLEAGGLVSEK